MSSVTRETLDSLTSSEFADAIVDIFQTLSSTLCFSSGHASATLFTGAKEYTISLDA